MTIFGQKVRVRDIDCGVRDAKIFSAGLKQFADDRRL